MYGFFIVALMFSTFYNLEYNPGTWHDEGAALSVSKTLAEDGVYGIRTSEGYQYFGPIQSVGPTVLIPVALNYKIWGVGLLQGRIVAAGYLLVTTLLFFGVAYSLFGSRVAWVAVVLLFGSRSTQYLFFGRQVLGEVPAIGFFLASWLVWVWGLRSGRFWFYPIAGILLGAAMVTKTTYMLLATASLTILIGLDFHLL